MDWQSFLGIGFGWGGRQTNWRTAMTVGVLAFVGEWAGLFGSSRRLSEIWWHFPLWLAFFYVAWLNPLWRPKRKPEEPTTLGL